MPKPLFNQAEMDLLIEALTKLDDLRRSPVRRIAAIRRLRNRIQIMKDFAPTHEFAEEGPST